MSPRQVRPGARRRRGGGQQAGQQQGACLRSGGGHSQSSFLRWFYAVLALFSGAALQVLGKRLQQLLGETGEETTALQRYAWVVVPCLVRVGDEGVLGA